jgi:hypothetical protein
MFFIVHVTQAIENLTSENPLVKNMCVRSVYTSDREIGVSQEVAKMETP